MKCGIGKSLLSLWREEHDEEHLGNVFLEWYDWKSIGPLLVPHNTEMILQHFTKFHQIIQRCLETFGFKGNRVGWDLTEKCLSMWRTCSHICVFVFLCFYVFMFFIWKMNWGNLRTFHVFIGWQYETKGGKGGSHLFMMQTQLFIFITTSHKHHCSFKFWSRPSTYLMFT